MLVYLILPYFIILCHTILLLYYIIYYIVLRHTILCFIASDHIIYYVYILCLYIMFIYYVYILCLYIMFIYYVYILCLYIIIYIYILLYIYDIWVNKRATSQGLCRTW